MSDDNPYGHRTKTDREFLTRNYKAHLAHLGAVEFDGAATDAVPIVSAYISMLEADVRWLQRHLKMALSVGARPTRGGKQPRKAR